MCVYILHLYMYKPEKKVSSIAVGYTRLTNYRSICFFFFITLTPTSREVPTSLVSLMPFTQGGDGVSIYNKTDWLLLLLTTFIFLLATQIFGAKTLSLSSELAEEGKGWRGLVAGT